jgi:Ras-related protein Rab-32
VDFCLKNLDYDESTSVTLQLWDIAGHERFGHMTRVYYKSAIAAIICFDISRPSTLDNVKKWKDDINDKVALPDGNPIPMILLATKCDLPDISIDQHKMSKFVQENNFLCWFETSAKTNQNIDRAFQALVGHIVQLSKTMELVAPTGGAADQANLKKSGDLNVLTTSTEQQQEQVQESKQGCCG